MNLSFDNTETAFAYKSDKDLKGARFLFSTMRKSWLVKFGLWITPKTLGIGFVKDIIRNTLFKQFVGGETLEETASVAEKLAQFNVKVILDYGVEGKEGEENYEHAMDEFIRVINYAATQPNIPFMSVKLTGMSRFGLLQKINDIADYENVVKGILPEEKLPDPERKEWERVKERLYKICEAAKVKNVGIMIDAEETWIQHPVDALVTQMMALYNIEKPVIYNTAQLYRHDRLQYIKDSNNFAKQKGFKCAFKLVRGAYMEKERERAAGKNYPSPINPTKEATDKEYNQALEYCIAPENDFYTIVGSHNEYSNLLATQLITKYNLPHNTAHVVFSQLYGMSDNITFNLAKAGYNASKYLPFGPIKDVIPYLMRRAEENSSLGGQTARELNLIKKEITRRKI